VEKTVGEQSRVIEYLRLPDVIDPGRYDFSGQKNPEGRLFLGIGSGIVHMWAVFEGGLKPGQIGEMNYTNVPGSYAVTGNFSQWLPGAPGPSPHAVQRKQLGDPLGRLTPPLLEQGTFDITINVYEQGEDKDPTIVQGAETNTSMPTMNIGHYWWTSHYSAIFHGGPFEQHGIVNYDLQTNHYDGMWVKTVQSNVANLQGDYDGESRTLVIEGDVRNCFGVTDPKTGQVYITRERRILSYPDANTKVLTVMQREIDSNGNMGKWVKRDHSVAKRRLPNANAGNVPCLGSAVFSLVGLQRSPGAARVIGQNNSTAHLPAAAGLVMLGPQWLGVFGDALRL
jgi:hypothetical protein